MKRRFYTGEVIRNLPADPVQWARFVRRTEVVAILAHLKREGYNVQQLLSAANAIALRSSNEHRG